jgi:hypothetical protein
MRILVTVMVLFSLGLNAQVGFDCKTADLTIDGTTLNLGCLASSPQDECCISDVSIDNGILTITEGGSDFPVFIGGEDNQFIDQFELIGNTIFLSLEGDNMPPSIITLQDESVNTTVPTITSDVDCDAMTVTLTIGGVSQTFIDLSCFMNNTPPASCEDIPLPDLDMSCGNGVLSYTLLGDPDGTQTIDAQCLFDIEWPKFANDAQAASGGLQEGEIFQTSGNATLPDGVLMVKQ